jgi:hypothetical protein
MLMNVQQEDVSKSVSIARNKAKIWARYLRDTNIIWILFEYITTTSLQTTALPINIENEWAVMPLMGDKARVINDANKLNTGKF